MAPRNAFIAAALVIALLGAAGAAAAEAGVAKARAHGPPDHAKAKGLAKHGDPAPTPPSGTTSEPPAPSPPATGIVSAPVATTAAAPPSTSATPPQGGSSAANLAIAAGVDIAPRTPTAPASESILEMRSGATTFSGGATTVRAPGWAGDARATPASGDQGAPWWSALAWALPFLGVGGVAILVATRLRAGPSAASARSDASRPRMAPVSPFDLEGLLRNGHGAVSRGALDEAVAWFERALAVSPRLGVAYFCKGVCLAANGEVADAYGALRSACVHAPEEMTYRVHFARVAVALGKHKEAMDALERVTSEMPELGPAMLEDPQLAGLRDHPRFLMICGEL